MSMEGLRQGAQNINSGKGGKGAQRASYYARWKPPQMADTLRRFLAAPPADESILGVSEPVVLLRGEYPDVYARNSDGSIPNPLPIGEAYHFKSHTFPVFIQPKRAGQQGFKTFRDLVCSAGPEQHAPQQCVGCHQVDHGADSKARDQWAFNIAHLGAYHHHPYVKDGQIQTKKGTGDPIMIKDECLTHKMENILFGRAATSGANARKPRSCESCAQGHPLAFGDHRVLQVGFSHLKNLFAVDEMLGERCMNCNTRIILTSFNCSNETCNTQIVDVASSGWTNDQIDLMAKTMHQCQHCQHVSLPYKEYTCGFGDNYVPVPGTGCPDSVTPKKATIFDCVLWLQREGEKMESKIVVKKIEPLHTYISHDGRPLSEHLNEIAPTLFNLSSMYAAETIDEQAKSINVPNPYAVQQQQFGAYGAAPGQPQAAPQGAPAGAAYPGMPSPGRPNFSK